MHQRPDCPPLALGTLYHQIWKHRETANNCPETHLYKCHSSNFFLFFLLHWSDNLHSCISLFLKSCHPICHNDTWNSSLVSRYCTQIPRRNLNMRRSKQLRIIVTPLSFSERLKTGFHRTGKLLLLLIYNNYSS